MITIIFIPFIKIIAQSIVNFNCVNHLISIFNLNNFIFHFIIDDFLCSILKLYLYYQPYFYHNYFTLIAFVNTII